MKRSGKNKDIKEYALRRMKKILEMAEKVSDSSYYWADPYFYSELQNLAYEFDEAFLITEGEGEEVNVFYFVFNDKYYRLYFRSSEEPMFVEETSEEEYKKRKLKLYSQYIRRRG
ncbi:MAG: hypothetical protein JTT16_01335 [Candidatus Brockarchaeota archaeon]|nr:hypothetical protein [Candidatus Brockarchaeota archaeon]MBO3801935.1 hypothetical protein [Candidatus Brockarchaeota archaeon]